jgi:hypothetical protein
MRSLKQSVILLVALMALAGIVMATEESADQLRHKGRELQTKAEKLRSEGKMGEANEIARDADKMFRWAEQVAPAEGHVDWQPFDHPQLGKVELGGWKRMAVLSNTPPALREKEIARFPQWLLWQALISPKIEVRETAVTPLGGDTWRVRLVVENTGWLPTYVSKMAVKHKLLRGVLAEIALPEGCALIEGRPRAELGELEGWAYLHTGISFWPNKRPTSDRAHADWIVRAPAATEVRFTAWHERAGRVSASVVLK